MLDHEMSWYKVWRKGFAPQLSTKGLEALQKALVEDDARLLQGDTTVPVPETMRLVSGLAVEGACVIGYCGWQGEGLETVSDVVNYFARVCYEVDKTLGNPAACGHFLCWTDDTPRAEMRKLLLEEVNRTLKEREGRREAVIATVP